MFSITEVKKHYKKIQNNLPSAIKKGLSIIKSTPNSKAIIIENYIMLEDKLLSKLQYNSRKKKSKNCRKIVRRTLKEKNKIKVMKFYT